MKVEEKDIRTIIMLLHIEDRIERKQTKKETKQRGDQKKHYKSVKKETIQISIKEN